MNIETPESEAQQKQTLKPTDEQKKALITLSHMITEAEISRRQSVAHQNPELSQLLTQKPGPESKCGCGTDTYAEGYFTISACGCGCNVAVPISATLAAISNNSSFNPSTRVNFTGIVHGQVIQPFNFQDVFLIGVLDVQKIIGIEVHLRLQIAPNMMTLFIYEGGRLLGSLVATYRHDFAVTFDGSGNGIFNPA